MITTIRIPNAASAALNDIDPDLRRCSVEGSGTG
jgi:hypothetical protein